MQISSILSRQTDAQGLGKRLESLETAAGALKPPANARTQLTAAQNEAVHKILSQYDMTNISGQKFAEMLQKLRETGALGENEVRDLGQIRLDLELSGVRPDEPVNLVEFYQQRLGVLDRQLRDPDASSGANRKAIEQSKAELQKRLDWIQKFSTLHSAPEPLAMDLMA